MPHFALVTVDGDTLGPHELDDIQWSPGSVIYRDDDEPDLRVVGQISQGDPERFDVLVVEPAE